MIENHDLIKRLQKLMSQKKSKRFYAERLGVNIEKINELLENVRKGITAAENEPEVANYISLLEQKVVKFDENIKEDKAEITAKLKDQITTLAELIEKCGIDIKVWNIDRYIQNYWGSKTDPHWQVKVWLSKKNQVDNFQKTFIEFLKNYKPKIDPSATYRVPTTPPSSSKSCLIINKQDQHLNKFDIGGENSIERRFDNILHKTSIILGQSGIVDEIYYVIGSDQFNSEWTGATTRGTKQENLLPYQDAFEKVCDFEVLMIKMLQYSCNKLNICYVSGNHDEYVGWHLITWLKAFYKDNSKVKFDTSYRYRKYVKYGNSAVMFNHGDAIKPQKLASMFPIEFKDQWSSCENYYIFTGDKHHEMSIDFGGIKFYQLPALSNSKSLWDDKQGHTCTKAELTAFLINEGAGITAILKQPI